MIIRITRIIGIDMIDRIDQDHQDHRDHRDHQKTEAVSLQGTTRGTRPETGSAGSLAPGLRRQRDLSIATGQVQGRKPPFAGQHVQGIVYLRQGVGILYCRQIQPAVVHTKSSSAVLLCHQLHRCRPRLSLGSI